MLLAADYRGLAQIMTVLIYKSLENKEYYACLGMSARDVAYCLRRLNQIMLSIVFIFVL